MARQLEWGRLAAEFLVIILGVLVALAADRWNQGRIDAELEAAYLSRFAAEIRADSLRAAQYLANFPALTAARDSLVQFVDGSAPPPELVSTVQRAFQELQLDPPATWNEILGTNSLLIIRDPAVRQAISRYYGSDRVGVLRNLERSDRRGRDRFVDALYPLGIFEGCVEQGDDCISAGQPLQPGLGSLVRFRRINPATFREVPGMRELLMGLASGQGSQVLFAGTAIQNAVTVLSLLP